MRHGKSGRQFGRNTSHRRAMLRALTANLVAHERIETTDAKAKELRRVAERVITKAIRLGPVAYTSQDKLSVGDRARRHSTAQQMGRFLQRFAVAKNGEADVKVDLIEKVFLDLAKRFKARPGGYTRIVKLGNRRGDNAPMSIVEFVDKGEARATTAEPKVKAKASEKAKQAATPAAPKAEKKPRAKKTAKKAEAVG
jgi:large subunit ribosomal protein L17